MSQAQPATSPALAFGNSLHAALEALHRPNQAPRDTDPTALLRRHWRSEGYGTSAQENEQFAVGAAALTRYCETRLPLPGQVLGTELYLARTIVQGGLRFELAGRIDRLMHQSNEDLLEATDYKTNQDGLVPASGQLLQDLATFIYYILVRLAYPDHSQIAISQLNLLSLQETRVVYDPEQRTTLKSQLLAKVAEIERGHFPPTPGAHCAWCPFRDDCPTMGATTLDGI